MDGTSDRTWKRTLNRLLFPVSAWLACDCAAQVLHVFESMHRRDDRPRRALDATRRYLRGECSSETVARARNEAHSSLWSCRRTTLAARAARSVIRASHLRYRCPWTEYQQAADEAIWIDESLEGWLVEHAALLDRLASRAPARQLLAEHYSQPSNETRAVLFDALLEQGYRPV